MTELNVRPMMNGATLTISPKDNLRRARALMCSGNVLKLLVVEEGKLVGVLNERDIWEHCLTGCSRLTRCHSTFHAIW
jgi:CBS domain-containing protein